jgi:hypothetical protein
MVDELQNDSNHSKVQCYLWDKKQTLYTTEFYRHGTSSTTDKYSGTCKFTGLSPNTTYVFDVSVYYPGGSTALWSGVSVQTLVAPAISSCSITPNVNSFSFTINSNTQTTYYKYAISGNTSHNGSTALSNFSVVSIPFSYDNFNIKITPYNTYDEAGSAWSTTTKLKDMFSALYATGGPCKIRAQAYFNSGFDNGNNFTWKLFTGDTFSESNVVSTLTTSTDWATFGGLTAWKKYRVRCTARDKYGKSSTWDSGEAQTTGYIAQLWADGYANSLTAEVSAYENYGYTKCVVYEGYKASGTQVGSAGWSYYSGTNNPSRTITGLTANKVYTVRFWVNDNASETNSECWDRSFICRPAHFNWTTEELNALKNKGKTTIITTARWDELVENVAQCAWWWVWNGNVNEKIENSIAIKNVLNAKFGTSDNKILTAEKFNKVRGGIGGINPLVNGKYDDINDQVKGNIIYGWYFITMVEKLNAKTHKRWSSHQTITGGV